MDFCELNVGELLQWVEFNPARINDIDEMGHTLVFVLVQVQRFLRLILWLLDEKGADVNATTLGELTSLHMASSPDIATALLDRGADPTIISDDGCSPLMIQAMYEKADVVARLLQDMRVRATVNFQDMGGAIALRMCACGDMDETSRLATIQFILNAGANSNLTNAAGMTPLECVQHHYPTHTNTIALLEQISDAEKAWLIVTARRLIVNATRNNALMPSYLQARIAQGQPVPQVMLLRTEPPRTVNSGHGEECRKLRILMAFLVGMAGGGMPQEVFRVVMELLMPSWDPLRRGVAGAGPQVQG